MLPKTLMKKILIVDDEPDLFEMIGFNLREEGYAVVTASSGPEALDQARAHLPDLILLDLMLPDLDGMAVCEILRCLPSTATIPIIMVSAWNSERSRVIGLELGADDYVTKPFSPRELVSRVNRALDPKHGPADTEHAEPDLVPDRRVSRNKGVARPTPKTRDAD